MIGSMPTACHTGVQNLGVGTQHVGERMLCRAIVVPAFGSTFVLIQTVLLA